MTAPRLGLRSIIALLSLLLAAGGASPQAASPPANLDLSHLSGRYTAGVPMIALGRGGRDVVVIWRAFSLPLWEPRDRSIAGHTPEANCYVSVSRDGGRTFRNAPLHLTSADMPGCNAVFAVTGPDGAIHAGGSIFAWGAPEKGGTWPGHVAFATSRDGGNTFGAAVVAVGTDTLDRFDPGIVPVVPETPTPWDGGRAAVDPQTGTLFVSGSRAIPPGRPEHAQRYITASHDGGKTFGAIHALDSGDWPEKWDGDFAASHGTLAAAYVAASVPRPGVDCPCVVFETSTDDGATFARRLVASAAEFTTKELVHYPEVAADPSRAGRFALTLVSADRSKVKVFITRDSGATWKTAIPQQPPGVKVVSRPGLGFSPDGRLIVAWRGMELDVRYGVYAAAVDKGGAGPVTRISAAVSTYPPEVAHHHLDGGDFVTWVSASREAAYFAWQGAPKGVSQVSYARLPLSALGSP